MNNYEALISKPTRIATFMAAQTYCSSCPCKDYCEDHAEELSEITCAEMICNWFKEEYKGDWNEITNLDKEIKELNCNIENLIENNELKAENEELKNSLGLANGYVNKYKQCLDEIEELEKASCKECLEKGNKSELYCVKCINRTVLTTIKQAKEGK